MWGWEADPGHGQQARILKEFSIHIILSLYLQRLIPPSLKTLGLAVFPHISSGLYQVFLPCVYFYCVRVLVVARLRKPSSLLKSIYFSSTTYNQRQLAPPSSTATKSRRLMAVQVPEGAVGTAAGVLVWSIICCLSNCFFIWLLWGGSERRSCRFWLWSSVTPRRKGIRIAWRMLTRSMASRFYPLLDCVACDALEHRRADL